MVPQQAKNAFFLLFEYCPIDQLWFKFWCAYNYYFLSNFPGFFQLSLHVKAGFIACLFLGVPEKTLNSSDEVCVFLRSTQKFAFAQASELSKPDASKWNILHKFIKIIIYL